MRKKSFLFAALGFLAAVLLLATAQQHEVFFGTSSDQPSNPYPGQLWVLWDNLNTTEAQPQIYDHIESEWDDIPVQDEAETITGNWDFTGTPTFEDITIGDDYDDTITLNGAVSSYVFHDDFCNIQVLETDGTAETALDGALLNIRTLAGGIYHVRLEQACAGDMFVPTASGCGLKPVPDDAENDGLALTFGQYVGTSYIHTVTSGSNQFYVEFSVTIADISDVDGDFAFGIQLPGANEDPPAHDDKNTYFLATLSDNAGDLDFEADVDGLGAANDDSGVTWGDTETKIVRFVVDGDGYSATVNGTAITLTNCNAGGNNDFTDLDTVIPFFQYTVGVAGDDPEVTINYIEWGNYAS